MARKVTQPPNSHIMHHILTMVEDFGPAAFSTTGTRMSSPSKSSTSKQAAPELSRLRRHFGDTIADYASKVNEEGLPEVEASELVQEAPPPLVVRRTKPVPPVEN
ncbi:hypothetical protein Tdes44962_MAKER00509 [Teratosphaeria destructans]|uniref:Uncharacterized protein n=1 Tax=Teratosphaeria destructans TaxID=418781 RepID=A0A9W7SQA0_9PEZI|nr:hypothetical protein Tdes44962_MAKER00509 [Teratosphaeria destructans]